MGQSKPDTNGVQICTCGGRLKMHGAWEYNGRIYTDKFKFTCRDCWMGWVCSAVEAENHQDGEEIEKHIKKIKELKLKIKERNKNEHH